MGNSGPVVRLERVTRRFGDLVAVRATWRGTHQGSFRGVPPIGRRIELCCMAFWRVAGGQIREYGYGLDDGALRVITDDLRAMGYVRQFELAGRE